jgi:hypothetical protein
MIIVIGVVAGVIVAAGTIAAGLKFMVNWIYGLGRKAEKEDADKKKMETDVEDLKNRLPRE